LYSRNNSELKNLNKIHKLCLPFTTIFSLKTYKEIKQIILEKKIDIVHVHNTLNLVSPSVYYAALSCKIPVVQTIHNFRLLCPAATFYREDRKGIGKICEMCVSKGLNSAVKHKCYRGSRMATLASASTLKIHRLLGTYKFLNYICLTEFNRDKLLQLNSDKKQVIDPNKIFIKPNFVEIDTQCIPYEQRKNQFVYAGRLDKLKGIRLLLEAWTEIDDSNLIICGTGPEEQWCKNYINENRLLNVKMLGFVTNTEVKKIIGESKALILPTQWYEGFPMTIVESLSSGTPVIGSNIGNVGSVIEDGVTGIKFKFDSVESLRSSIKKLTDMVSSSRYHYQLNYISDINYK
ncbi:glycosyltransferase family 4 protein, partial [Neobacillus niacini]|uniref:glycosyltransferase family 4 protein n=1 Tax=Neobacillus niacini TaxID=86668 RepID=UPI002FFE7560